MPLDDMSLIVTASAAGFCVSFFVAALLGFSLRSIFDWMSDFVWGFRHEQD